MLFNKHIITPVALALLSISVNAKAVSQKQILVAPHCLLKTMNHYAVMATTKTLSLVSLSQDSFNQFLQKKKSERSHCGNFMNVTDAWQETMSYHNALTNNKIANTFLQKYSANNYTLSHTTAYHIRYTQETNTLLTHLNPQNMWDNLTTFSKFPDRYADSDTGVQAANWLKTQVEQIAKQYGRDDVTTFTIATGSSYQQPSIVVKVGHSTAPGIVIGAHMDTLQAYFDAMPGADDDGSGSVTVLEIARTILSSPRHFNKPIYFIWYSAEEMGLVGSQHVVAAFKKQHIAVENVLHFDMTGYAYQKDPSMWLITDNTNKQLTDFLAKLIDTYVKKPIKYTACGYACSDHATWNKNGYPAAIAFEAQFEKYNPYVHSNNDTMTLLSLEHMADYAKLGIAFAVELAEPNQG